MEAGSCCFYKKFIGTIEEKDIEAFLCRRMRAALLKAKYIRWGYKSDKEKPLAYIYVYIYPFIERHVSSCTRALQNLLHLWLVGALLISKLLLQILLTPTFLIRSPIIFMARILVQGAIGGFEWILLFLLLIIFSAPLTPMYQKNTE